MRQLFKIIKSTYRRTLTSIAFYPVLISVLCIALAIIASRLEYWKPILSLKEKFPYFFIQDYETARSILSVFIGGVISLTVFSFSMVMVVLSQASANFSPRLLPGLISNKKHQIILGVYTGTLLYCIIILTVLGASGIDSKAIGLSTMFAATLSVTCIGLFVYFIHSISSAVQIQNIIDDIFCNCENYIQCELVASNENKIAVEHISTNNWHPIYGKENGYFNGFDIDLLSFEFAKKNHQIAVIPYMNKHLWRNMPVFRTKELCTVSEQEDLLRCLDIAEDRHEDDYGTGGMMKLKEIAVKAMSPGINDPGTAIDAIAKLAPLLRKFLQLPNTTSTLESQGNCIVLFNRISTEELIFLILQPIRLYSKNDPLVIRELINAIALILDEPEISKNEKEFINKELKALKEDITENIINTYDKQSLYKEINKHIVS